MVVKRKRVLNKIQALFLLKCRMFLLQRANFSPAKQIFSWQEQFSMFFMEFALARRNVSLTRSNFP